MLTRRHGAGTTLASSMETEREPGYRRALERPTETPEAVGEVLAPTPADRAALSRLRARDRTSIYGIVLAAAVCIRWVAPLLTRTPYIYGAWLAGAALLVYALARWLRRPDIGHAIVKLAPDGEITAGQRLGVIVLWQPRATYDLNPMLVRLVARRGDRESMTVAYETTHRVADQQAVGADEPVRLETTIAIPEDAPPTSSRPLVRWRLEVTLGERREVLRSVAVRVRAPTRRRRKHVEPSA